MTAANGGWTLSYNRQAEKDVARDAVEDTIYLRAQFASQVLLYPLAMSTAPRGMRMVILEESFPKQLEQLRIALEDFRPRLAELLQV